MPKLRINQSVFIRTRNMGELTRARMIKKSAYFGHPCYEVEIIKSQNRALVYYKELSFRWTSGWYTVNNIFLDCSQVFKKGDVCVLKSSHYIVKIQDILAHHIFPHYYCNLLVMDMITSNYYIIRVSQVTERILGKDAISDPRIRIVNQKRMQYIRKERIKKFLFNAVTIIASHSSKTRGMD